MAQDTRGGTVGARAVTGGGQGAGTAVLRTVRPQGHAREVQQPSGHQDTSRASADLGWMARCAALPATL